MESKRQEKFARQIQRDLGEIFQQTSRDWFGGAFITVSEVKVSPDLSHVRAYLSLFQVTDKDKMLEEVRLRGKELRKSLAQRLRNQVRKIPELEFFLDESLDYAQHMEEVFKKLREDENRSSDEQDQ